MGAGRCAGRAALQLLDVDVVRYVGMVADRGPAVRTVGLGSVIGMGGRLGEAVITDCGSRVRQSRVVGVGSGLRETVRVRSGPDLVPARLAAGLTDQD